MSTAKNAGLQHQAEVARQAQAEAERAAISALDLDVRILARELHGREGRDLEVAVRAIDRMTAELAALRRHLAAEGEREAGQ